MHFTYIYLYLLCLVGTGTTLAVMGVAIGAIAAALIGVVVWRKFQARGESQEAQQLMDSCEI